jgi:hypothetical protein
LPASKEAIVSTQLDAVIQSPDEEPVVIVVGK